MLILMPLKTQENAVAKWTGRGVGNKFQMGSSCIFNLRRALKKTREQNGKWEKEF